MKDRKEKINKPFTDIEINFNLLFFLEIMNWEIEKIKDSESNKFPKYIVINWIYNTTFFKISELTIRHMDC